MTESSQDQLGQDRFAHSALLDAMPDAIVIVDPEGRIVGFNSMAQAMFGYDRTDVLGERNLLARHKDGREFAVEISLAPFQAPEGSLVVSAIRAVAGRRGASD